MTRPVAVLLLIGLLACAGCEAGPRAAGRGGSAGLLIDPVAAKELGYTIAWASDLGLPAGQKIMHAEVLGDVIVMIESPNVVSALALSDGRLLWTQIVGRSTTRLFAPTRWDEKILISSETELSLLDAATGRLMERQNLNWAAANAPVVVLDTAAYGAINGRVFGHDLVSGFADWAYQMGAQIKARPAASDEQQIFAASIAGDYAMFNRNGELLWKSRTHDRISADPVIERNTVYVPSEDQSLYAIHRQTGRDLWVYRTTQPLEEPVVAIDRAVYLPLGGRGLVALDAANGKELWKLSEAARPVVQRGNQILMRWPGALGFVEVANGQVLSQVPVARLEKVLSTPDGAVVLLSSPGRVVRLQPGT